MLTDNIVFLKNNYPKIYEEIVKVENNNLNDSIFIEQTRNNQKTMKIIRDDKEYYFHSKYDPLREAESIIKKLEENENIDENSHVVFYGLGLGYHIDIFMQKYPNTPFSLYEPSIEVLRIFLDNINLKKLSGDSLVLMHCEFDHDELGVFLSTLLTKENKKFIIMDLPIYGNVFKEQHSNFFSKFNEMIKSKRINLHTNYAYQKRWIINCMKNLKEVLSTPNMVTEGMGNFKNKTAILVAAGPSLNEEIENLRYIKDNGLAYIFSVGSAVNTLIHYGIYPHATSAIDPSPKNKVVFQTIIEKEIREIPIIFGTSAGHKTLEEYPGEKYHMITSQDSISSYYLKNSDGSELNIVYDAPTVAAVTLQLLCILGFEKIILVGQNLGYRDKKKYSEGITYHRNELTDEELKNSIWVQDVYENDILTTDLFITMRKHIEFFIKRFPNIKIINTTKGGAKIEGTEFIELKSIIENDLNHKIVDKDNLLGVGQNKTSYDKETLFTKLKNMDKSYENALKINKDYKDVLNKIDKAINNKTYSQAQNLYVKLNKELRRIENNDFYKTFILPMNRIQYKILADSIESLNAEKNPHEQGKRVLKSFGNFIDICINDIEALNPIYNEIKESIKEYIEINSMEE